MPKIVLKDITKEFEDKFVAVDNLNMTIEDRDFITLLGPSGCGKTTTLRMIAGLERPTRGKITINDVVVFDSEKGINLPPDKRDVGFLFQNYALWPHMTVYQNIAFGLENLKWKKADIKDRVDELLKMLKIEKFINRYPSELSGGQQQRVAIARTLAPKPKVLFMDEPLSNLDAKLRSEMRTELKRLHIDTNSTFMFVTHDQLEAMTLSTKVCLMESGKLQQYSSPLVMYENPANVFVADFMGNPSINFEECNVIQKEDSCLILDFMGTKIKYKMNEATAFDGDKVVLGIRPEYITINKDKGIPSKIYTTLPTGMETTVKAKIKDRILSVVVFGNIDFAIDSDIDINFTGNKIILFDTVTKKSIAQGSLEIC